MDDLHQVLGDGGLAPKGESLVFGVHHKTGTELATKAAGCFDPLFNHKEVKMFTCTELPANERAVHFTRNPINLALSAYLYHKATGEAWTWKAGSAKRLLDGDAYSAKYVRGNEAYTQFLRRVPHRTGIRAEMYRLTQAGSEFDQIQTGMRNCHRSSRCIEICLEDFTVSSKSYDASWRKVVNFMGKGLTPKLENCLSKEDLHKHTGDKRHVTSDTLPEALYNELRKMVWQVDSRSFNNRLRKLGQGRLSCGGASKFLLRQDAAANATATDAAADAVDLEHGGGYKEWLIEEEYSKSWGV